MIHDEATEMLGPDASAPSGRSNLIDAITRAARSEEIHLSFPLWWLDYRREFAAIGRDISTQRQSAAWYQAVASHRWMRCDPLGGYAEGQWWYLWRGVMALRWSLNERRGAPAGFLPSGEVALREPGVIESTASEHACRRGGGVE